MPMSLSSTEPCHTTHAAARRALDARQSIRRYVQANFHLPDDFVLADNTSFLDHRLVDSMGVLEIALFLEQTFGFTVRDDEMLVDNLDSVEKLTAFVERRLRES